jgi:hypothetical protein
MALAKSEGSATLANPASKTCRITYDQREVGYVPGHNRSSTHHCESSDLEAGENSCVGANTAALFEQRLKAFPLRAPTAWPKIVHKNGSRPDENIIFRY